MEEQIDKNIFYYQEEPVISEQKDKYTLIYNKCTCGRIGCGKNIELNNNYFFRKIRELSPIEIIPLLDFHLKKYKGNPKDFVINTRTQFYNLPSLRGKPNLAYLKEWVDDKTEHLKNRIEIKPQQYYYDAVSDRPLHPYQLLNERGGIVLPEHSDPNYYSPDEVDRVFIKKFITLDIVYIESMLNYHFEWYKHEKSEWLNHTRWLVERLLERNPTRTSEMRRALEWIEGKKQSSINFVKDSNLRTGSIITDRQQALAFYYLDKAFKIRNSNTKADYGRFVLWLLDIGAEKITTHNITKKYLRQPATANGESIKSLELLIQDVETVRSEFNKISCFPVLKEIDKDLSKLKAQLTELKPF